MLDLPTFCCGNDDCIWYKQHWNWRVWIHPHFWCAGPSTHGKWRLSSLGSGRKIRAGTTARQRISTTSTRHRCITWLWQVCPLVQGCQAMEHSYTNKMTFIQIPVHYCVLKAKTIWERLFSLHKMPFSVGLWYYSWHFTITRPNGWNIILCVPSVKTETSGQRSFSYAGPVIWNKLPYDIRSSQSETHLFSTHY